MTVKDYTSYPLDLQPAKDLMGFIVEGPNHLNAKDVVKGVVIGYDMRPIQGGADHVYLIVIPQGLHSSLVNRRYIRVQDITWSSPHKVFDAPDTYPSTEAQTREQEYQAHVKALNEQTTRALGVPAEILYPPETQEETQGDTPQP